MKITAIRVSHHALPLDPPFRAGWDPRPRQTAPATIVRVETDRGLTGIGSGDAMTGFGGHEALFVGQDPRDLDRHHRVLTNLAFHYGRCWPLDIALWDLFGKIAGQPVWRLLGGRRRRIPLYASSGTLRDPAAMAEAAGQYVEAGFAAMKLRFHRADWRQDVAAVEAVRARVGDRLTLMVDCNQGWRMPWDTSAPWRLKDALAVARALEPLDIFWLEEPLDQADRRGMVALRQATPIRVAGAEMVREAGQLRDLIADGCLDVIQPDAALTEGITGLARVAALAEAAGIMFTPHTWTNGIGVLANIQLVGGSSDAPFVEYPFDPPEWSPARRDFMLTTPLSDDGYGHFVLPETPGLGIVLDEDRLAATRVG
ncbi:MAG: mandelate racemase/muconate lactonizing enzyme family protein [Azospirillaceae bacterium]